MSLTERLLRYGFQPAAPSAAEAPAGRPAHEPTDALDGRVLDEFVSRLGGRQRVGPAGPYWVVERELPPDQQHGAMTLGSFGKLDFAALAALTRRPDLARLTPDDVAIFDTETTGLAGGTGTTIFLAGVASIRAGVLHLRQYFLPDPSAELPFLAALRADLARFSAVFSFNGARFDLPLLETRLLLHHQIDEWPFLHVDLLHPARRLWRRGLESCSLESLERAILAARRQVELPGWEIPSRYFAFLHQRDLSLVEPVFDHNANDLISLTLLGVRLSHVVASPEETADPLRIAERFGLATLAEQHGDWSGAARHYEAILRVASSAPWIREVCQRLGRVYRRLSEREKALVSWETVRAVARDGGADAVRARIEATIELAKHHEHHQRDLVRALELAREALHLVQLTGGERELQAAIERRIDRLQRKLNRRHSAGPGNSGASNRISD